MKPKLSTKQSMAKSAGVIGSLTFVSRVLGFIRDILIARFFGTGLAAEAFVVSFKIPNLFRDLVGEGAMSAAFVPVLSEVRARKGEEEFWHLTTTLFYWFSLILVAICVLGIIFSPAVVKIAAPGFVQDVEKFNLTVMLTRMMFPFMMLIGISALMMGVLHTLKSFATSALAPCLLNISMIGSLFFLVPIWGVKGLVYGVLAGGLFQCLVQVISFKGTGFHFVKNHSFSPAVKKIFKLLGPRVWGTAVYQVSVFVDMILASFYWIVGNGGQSALYYSSRLFQLPLALFGVSFAQAALPTLSGHFAQNELKEYKEAMVFSLKHVIFSTLPAAIGLAVFSDVIITILLKRGAFTDYSATVTSNALFYYSFGLLSCGLIKVLVSGFYALQDTKTPVKTATISLFANIGFNLMFMWHLKIGGLALATSLAATLNAIFLYVLLRRKIGSLASRELLTSFLKSLFAGIIMAAVCLVFFKPWIYDAILNATFKVSIFRLMISIIICIVFYFMISLLIRSDEAKSYINFLFKDKKNVS